MGTCDLQRVACIWVYEVLEFIVCIYIFILFCLPILKDIK